MSSQKSHAQQIRQSLKHPIIDADGHWLEFGPVIAEQLEKHGGKIAVDGFRAFNGRVSKALAESGEERKRKRVAQEAFWAVPTKNTLDRATELLPKLLYQRLDEFGIDFSVLYPTSGLGVPFHPDAETRRATSRAFNSFIAEFFADYSDRMTPAAVIPMHTPEEAIDELEHVKKLGLKVVMMASMVRRPIPAAANAPAAPRFATWLDMLGLDSEYDYDPVWAKCVELGISPTFHSGSRGLGMRISPSNFVYNHIGHFAAASEAVCKALFLGGVTRRFPTLKIAFLEGGVGWACSLYSDLIGHWKKRNREALEEVNPANLDRPRLARLIREYGGKWIANRIEIEQLDSIMAGEQSTATGGLRELDDFAACKISRAEDIRDLFANNFYFGCEADDPSNAYAFNRKSNPYGAKLNVLFGSDIGHFDVQDMKGVVPEAYELVEEQLITAADFRDFMFTNPVRFWGEANPNFFKGTRVEKEAAALLAGG